MAQNNGNFQTVSFIEPLNEQGDTNDLAAKMEELRSGIQSWADEVMAQAVAAAAQVSSTSTATAQSFPATTPAEEPEEE